jgi:hypothetical protein
MICGLNCPEGSFYDIFSHKIPPYSKYTFFYLKRVEGVVASRPISMLFEVFLAVKPGRCGCGA